MPYLVLYANATKNLEQTWYKPRGALDSKCSHRNSSHEPPPSLHNCTSLYTDTVSFADGSTTLVLFLLSSLLLSAVSHLIWAVSCAGIRGKAVLGFLPPLLLFVIATRLELAYFVLLRVLKGRERPALMFNMTTGFPMMLYTGAISANASAPWHVLAQPIRQSHI